VSVDVSMECPSQACSKLQRSGKVCRLSCSPTCDRRTALAMFVDLHGTGIPNKTITLGSTQKGRPVASLARGYPFFGKRGRDSVVLKPRFANPRPQIWGGNGKCGWYLRRTRDRPQPVGIEGQTRSIVCGETHAYSFCTKERGDITQILIAEVWS